MKKCIFSGTGNSEHVQNSGNSEHVQNSQKSGNSEHVQNSQKSRNSEHVQNSDNSEHVQDSENHQKSVFFCFAGLFNIIKNCSRRKICEQIAFRFFVCFGPAIF